MPVKNWQRSRFSEAIARDLHLADGSGIGSLQFPISILRHKRNQTSHSLANWATGELVPVPKPLVSQIKLEATLDLTQTSMRLSLGSCADFVFPHLEGLMSLNSCTHTNLKDSVRLGVLYPFPEWTKADLNSQPQRSRQELKPLHGISVVSFLEMTRFVPPSRSTPYGFARLEITVKTIPTDGVTTPCIPNNTCSYL